MRAAVVGMTLVAVLVFASDRSYGQPNPFQQQQPRRLVWWLPVWRLRRLWLLRRPRKMMRL